MSAGFEPVYGHKEEWNEQETYCDGYEHSEEHSCADVASGRSSGSRGYEQREQTQHERQ